MSTRTLKVCDVSGVVHNVESYRITIEKLIVSNPEEAETLTLHQFDADLSDVKYDRLVERISALIRPAKRRG